MESLSFIFKRFFYSLLSGCIINFYIIIYYLALKKIFIFPSFFDIIISFVNIHPHFVFVIIAILIGIITEGICQISFEISLDFYNKENIFIGKKFKDFIKIIEKTLFLIYKIKKLFVEFHLIYPTIFGACKYYSGNGKNNPMKNFITDSKITSDVCIFFKSNITYDAVLTCASLIERGNKASNIYHYRDHSFIMQMLRLSFLCIAILTFISEIIILILWEKKPELFICTENIIYFFVFISIILLISIILTSLTGKMSLDFAKRFIREVGFTYEALKLKLPIDNGIADHEKPHDEGKTALL